jgi:Flp pilus assembly protein TadG
VAAVEFAFLAPVLIILYFMTVEVSHAIDTNRKVNRAASMIADLITQNQSLTPSDLDAIMRIGDATLQPYNRTGLSVYITAIEVSGGDGDPVVAKAVWSRKKVAGAGSRYIDPPGQQVDLPTEYMVPGKFLIHVVAQLDYRPLIVWTADAKQKLGLLSAFDNINMSEEYYAGPRLPGSIDCDAC